MRKQDAEAILQRDSGPIETYLDALASELRLPEVALAMCTMRIEEAAPALRAVLAKGAAGEALSDPESMLLFRGLYVLGAARDHDAFQPLLRLLRRPDDELEDLLGDAITSGLPRIVAGVFDGDAEALFALIADQSLDAFLRGSLLEGAAFLAWEGRIDRDRMRRFLVTFHEDRLAKDDEYVWISWLQTIALLGFRDLAPMVESAWTQGRIPEGIMERRHFEQDLADAERAPGDISRFESCNGGYIDDVVEALDWTRHWGDEPSPLADKPGRAPEPVVNPWRDVGRNDPCPCGSGKKAKKCCLAS